MEGACAVQSTFTLCNSSRAGPRPALLIAYPSDSKLFVSSSWFSAPSIKCCPTIFRSNEVDRTIPLCRRRFAIRASASSESNGSTASIAPLRLESPIGQVLSQILISHPHLLPAAVDQQLDQLQTDYDAEKQKEEPSPSASGTDLVLYRRIAEVKANERRRALEEILYALIVQKFVEANVSLIPKIIPDDSRRVDAWPRSDEKLEQLHSSEAYEMIQNHLALILGNRLGDLTSVAHISKLRAGQVYAASVMYGYFLKRIDQRFQLEKTVKLFPDVFEEEEGGNEEAIGEEEVRSIGDESFQTQTARGRPEHGTKPYRLRTYVMSFDGDTLQKYATIRSKEAVGIIEKHTEALFGRPEIVMTRQGTVDLSKDEPIRIRFGALRRLVLEAVTFGSFLWDVESYVDSRYHFVVN